MLKRHCTLARNTVIAWILLTLASCTTVTCSECTTGYFSLLNSEPKSALQPHFPALKYAHHPADSKYRHIYLEGDGNAWHKGRTPSTNPTSRQKLALQLMLQDASDSLYLDRPCYGYKTMPEPCHNLWWTSARYGEAIVTAMNEGLDGLQAQLGQKPLVLIGHSGGGALAVLLAQRRSDVHAVITLAGNLAPQQWAEHHGYLPLDGSLTPEPNQLSETILQWHYASEDDTNVPPKLIAGALKDAAHAAFIIDKGHHTCCWQKHWSTILDRMHVALAHQPPKADDMAHK